MERRRILNEYTWFWYTCRISNPKFEWRYSKYSNLSQLDSSSGTRGCLNEYQISLCGTRKTGCSNKNNHFLRIPIGILINLATIDEKFMRWFFSWTLGWEDETSVWWTINWQVQGPECRQNRRYARFITYFKALTSIAPFTVWHLAHSLLIRVSIFSVLISSLLQNANDPSWQDWDPRPRRLKTIDYLSEAC